MMRHSDTPLPLSSKLFSEERNPYKKSTIPIWAEAEVEMQRPDEEPLIPFVVDRCYIEPNCSNDSNGTVDCGNGTNATILGWSGGHAGRFEDTLSMASFSSIDPVLSRPPGNLYIFLQGSSQFECAASQL